MHFDIAHAAISAILIIATLLGLRTVGIEHEKGKWSWPIFFAIFVVMAVFNFIWP